ncbi:MAG: DUF1801 domain-containing protein [Acidobacteriota bacterium]
MPRKEAPTPDAFIAALPEPRRSEIAKIDALIRKTVPKLERVMYGKMIGYGPFRYRYASGREGDACKLALASQKGHISLYTCATSDDGVYVAEKHAAALGKASVGKSCIRFQKLTDLDAATLKKVLRETARGTYGV